MAWVSKKPAGRSVQVSKKNEDQDLKKELAELKAELLAQLAAILGEVKAAQVLGMQAPKQQDTPKDDEPIFIPNKIIPDIEVDINIETTESKENGLDSAAEALKKIRKTKEEDNERE